MESLDVDGDGEITKAKFENAVRRRVKLFSFIG